MFQLDGAKYKQYRTEVVRPLFYILGTIYNTVINLGNLMANHANNRTGSKLIIYRLIALAIIAFLLVQLNIVTDSMSGSDFSLYIFALILALPITMLLDRYIVKFARKGSLK
jgi:hypothetical protein